MNIYLEESRGVYEMVGVSGDKEFGFGCLQLVEILVDVKLFLQGDVFGERKNLINCGKDSLFQLEEYLRLLVVFVLIGDMFSVFVIFLFVRCFFVYEEFFFI